MEIMNFCVHASLFQQQSIKNYWYFKDGEVNLPFKALLAKYANRDGTDNYNDYNFFFRKHQKKVLNYYSLSCIYITGFKFLINSLIVLIWLYRVVTLNNVSIISHLIHNVWEFKFYVCGFWVCVLVWLGFF